MGGLFKDQSRTIFEEKDIGRAPFAFKDPFEALMSPQTARETLTDVPESGPGPEPITVSRRVESPAPGSSLLRTLATVMALRGNTGLANLLQRQQQGVFDDAQESAERRSLKSKKTFEARQKEFEESQPQFTFDKTNDRITVINPKALKSGQFKDAVKFISLRDPKATISGIQESLGVPLTEAEQKGLTKIIESGDDVLFRQTVDKIGKRAAADKKAAEFQEELPNLLNQADALNKQRPFDQSEVAQFEAAVSESQRQLSGKPVLDFITDIRNERRSDVRTLKIQSELEKRQANREAATERRTLEREERAAQRAQTQTEIVNIRSKLTDLRSRLRTVDNELRFAKTEPLIQEKSLLETAISEQESALAAKTAELGGDEGRSLQKAAPKVKVGDIVEHQGKRKKVIKVNDNGTVVLEPIK